LNPGYFTLPSLNLAHSTTLPRIPVNIKQICESAILDTGANISILSITLVRKFKNIRLQKWTKVGMCWNSNQQDD